MQENVSLAPLTTLGVGGAARFFSEAKSVDEVIAALGEAKRRDLGVAVLGGGSNTLVPDAGVDGLVLRIAIPGITFHERAEGTVAVTAGAGVVWDDLVRETVTRGLGGLESLSGVPGTVGGAVVSSIGAYGAQVSDTLESVEVIDRTNTAYALRMLPVSACALSYHDSVFAREPAHYLITAATFVLRSGAAAQPAYEDYRFRFPQPQDGHTLTLADVRAAVLDIREAKGTLIMEGRESYRCAGSFFHMPFVTKEMYEQVVRTARTLDAEKEARLQPWAWAQPDGSYKLAPGFLLEYTEFQKGYVRGGAGISPKHTLSIINLGDAHAVDIARLADDMQHAVEHIFGVRLEREVETLIAR
ncbi:MAG TPA: UDP-N-acetylmuramate dehydrogenase [Candidatus Paceibacterota bacterium]